MARSRVRGKWLEAAGLLGLGLVVGFLLATLPAAGDVLDFESFAEGHILESDADLPGITFQVSSVKATGNVEGVTGDGQRYNAPWVRYEHEAALLLTDAAVTVVDQAGTYRGDGFRYFLEERRFQLIGNVSVEQGP